MSKNTPTIVEQLKHLDAEYRYLSQACHAWNKVCTNHKTEITSFIDSNFAELSTIVQDSIFVHTRTLLEFFQGSSKTTDIQLASLLKNPKDKNKFKQFIDGNNLLKNLKKQIEVHCLHMTFHRDENYRRKNANYKDNSKQQEVQRRDFNNINSKIFDEMIKLLNLLRNHIHDKYRQNICDLIKMSTTRYKKGSGVDWVSIV